MAMILAIVTIFPLLALFQRLSNRYAVLEKDWAAVLIYISLIPIWLLLAFLYDKII